jgi:hypothetical protein
MNCTDDVKQQIKNSLCDDLSYLYEDLVNKKYSINNLNLWFNFYHNYVYEKKIRVEEREKRCDTSFRKQVKERYNNCCMITQKIPEVCEVAHIYPHCASNIDDKYNIDNGFYLCKELHSLFDHPNYHMKINPETHLIEFTDYIMNNTCMSEYHKYNNKKITLTPNNISYLKMKYDNK